MMFFQELNNLSFDIIYILGALSVMAFLFYKNKRLSRDELISSFMIGITIVGGFMLLLSAFSVSFAKEAMKSGSITIAIVGMMLLIYSIRDLIEISKKKSKE